MTSNNISSSSLENLPADFYSDTDQFEDTDTEEGNEEVENQDELDKGKPAILPESGKEEGKDEDESSASGEEGDSTIIDDLKAELGLDGEYEATDEGIKQMFADYKTKQDEDTPILAEIREHIKAGGTLDTFRAEQELTEWEKIEVLKEGDDAEQNQIAWITNGMKAKGSSDRVIKATIDALKVEGEEALYEVAVEERNYLEQEDKKVTEKFVTEQKAVVAEQQRIAKENYDTDVKILSGTTLLGLKFDKKEMEAIKANVYGKENPDRITFDKLTNEQKLMVEYIISTGVDLTKLAGRQVKAQQQNPPPRNNGNGKVGLSIHKKTGDRTGSQLSDDETRELLNQVSFNK